MGRDLLAFVFHSPRRLLLVVVAPVVVVAMGTALISRGGSDADVERSSLPDSAVVSTATPQPTDPRLAEVTPAPPPEQAVRVAREFIAVWLAGPTTPPEEWELRLRPYVTPTLAQGLRATDPGRIPEATVAGPPTAGSVGEFLTQLSVPLSNGSSVQVTATWDGSAWRISDIQPG